MTARNSPRGFVPTRHLTGGQSFRAGPRRQTSGSNAAEIRQNDPVYLDSNGNIQRLVTASAGAPPALGVVAAVYDSNKRPRTHALPSSSPVIAASTEGFVDVYEDPFIVFTVHASASLGQSDIGNFADIVYTANGTAAGISGAVLGASVTASSIGHHLKIVGISTNEGEDSPPVGGANNDVEVIFVQHMWTNPIRRNTVEVL